MPVVGCAVMLAQAVAGAASKSAVVMASSSTIAGNCVITVACVPTWHHVRSILIVKHSINIAWVIQTCAACRTTIVRKNHPVLTPMPQLNVIRWGKMVVHLTVKRLSSVVMVFDKLERAIFIKKKSVILVAVVNVLP